jgi:hypothetical protein
MVSKATNRTVSIIKSILSLWWEIEDDEGRED